VGVVIGEQSHGMDSLSRLLATVHLILAYCVYTLNQCHPLQRKWPSPPSTSATTKEFHYTFLVFFNRLGPAVSSPNSSPKKYSTDGTDTGS